VESSVFGTGWIFNTTNGDEEERSSPPFSSFFGMVREINFVSSEKLQLSSLFEESKAILSGTKIFS
jgi:hypothetical protein